ncbi:MAG: S8 family serine peptidase [Vicinamibacterales bacterium]
MRRSVSVASAALLAMLIASAVPFAQGPAPGAPPSETAAAEAPPAATGDETPHAWFVQLASPPTVDGGTTHALDAEEAAFHRVAVRAGIEYTERRHFRDLWNGLVIETPTAGDELKGLPGVSAVYPVLIAHRTQTQDGNGDTAVSDMVTALSAGGADVAQDKLGLTGTGVRVAVLDSGIDYHHPDLGGCFGQGCRVETGWDFVGDAFNPDRQSPRYDPVMRPDADPDDCDGHGTHVTGIIGANGTVRGVAPAVTFLAYRVFGCDGPTTTDVILAAMERAYLDGAEVLNLSLGAPYQWPGYPTAASASRLVRKGLVVVASGGNVAAGGLYAADAPGVGEGVISVASFDNTHATVASFRVSPDGRQIGYIKALGSPAVPNHGSAPVALASAIEACTPLPAGSLTGRVALVRRGTCPFPIKAANAQAAGALAVLIANNVVEDRITIDVGSGIAIPVVSIQAEEGALIASRLAAGPVTLTWTADVVSEPQLRTGNRISSFSSYGPSPDLALKPDLGAPGGAIRSTIPIELGSFGTISGTSMAAPYVTGAIALLREASPRLSAADALVRLQNTAQPQYPLGATSGLLDLVHRQGAGLVNVARAAESTVSIIPSRLQLGDFDTPTPVVRRLRIREFAKPRRHRAKHRHGRRWHSDPDCQEVTYTLSHEPAQATGASTFAPTRIGAAASVEFPEPTVTVGRGHRGGSFVKVLITPPTNSDARIFGGYITLTPDGDGPVLRVPYIGYSGDYQAIQALAPTPNGFPWLARLIGTTLANQPVGAIYSMVGDDTPIIVFHLDHQVRTLRANVFRMKGTEAEWVGVADEQHFVARNSTATSFFVLAWNGVYVDKLTGTSVPAINGTYRIQLHALKAGGNKRNPAHYEEWTSPDIRIAR